MKTWGAFASEEPDLAKIGLDLLFPSPPVGLAFLATLRKDGAPRLHPVSLVISRGHLYTLVPPASPKCADLIRDGRYALQAFPTSREDNQEFYIAGRAECLRDSAFLQSLIADTQIHVVKGEVLFELLLDRVMYTRVEDWATAAERPVHRKWRATRQ